MRLDKGKILDGATWRPPMRVLRVADERGVIRELIEKLPGIRSEVWLNPAGMTIALPFGCANARAEDGATPYREQKRASKLAAGWLPWGKCPVALVASQLVSTRNVKAEELLDPTLHQPCMGGGFGPQNPCPHALIEQAWRRSEHERRQAIKAEAYKKETEVDREQRERHHDETIAALTSNQNLTIEALRALLDKAVAQGTPQVEPPSGTTDGGGYTGGKRR